MNKSQQVNKQYDLKLRQIIDQQKSMQKFRKQIYAQQLKNHINLKQSQAKRQKEKIQIQNTITKENLKIINMMEEARNKDVAQLRKKVKEDNVKSIHQLQRRSYDKSMYQDKDFTKQLNFLQQISGKNSERQNKQKQSQQQKKLLNFMQQQLKKQTKVKKKQQNLSMDMDYLKNMEIFEQKRRKQKQDLEIKHRQNMILYQKLKNVNNQKSPNHQSEIRDSSNTKQLQQQYKNKKQDDQWKKILDKQLRQKKQKKINQQRQRNYQRQLFQRNILQLQKPLSPFRQSGYIKDLEMQMQEQRKRRQSQKNYRKQGNLQFPNGNLSPAILGKVYSHQRHKQWQHLDKNFGVNISNKNLQYRNTLKNSGQLSLNNINDIKQQNTQLKQFNNLKLEIERLKNYDQNNNNKSRLQKQYQHNTSYNNYENKNNNIYGKLTNSRLQNANYNQIGQESLQKRNDEQLKGQKNNVLLSMTVPKLENEIKYENSREKSPRILKSYDFISNRSRLYNLEV